MDGGRKVLFRKIRIKIRFIDFQIAKIDDLRQKRQNRFVVLETVTVDPFDQRHIFFFVITVQLLAKAFSFQHADDILIDDREIRI